MTFDVNTYPEFWGICFGWVLFTIIFFWFRDVLKGLIYLFKP